MRRLVNSSGNIKAIDLFCGVGGLTHGFVRKGINVVAGIDNDKSCEYAYEKNNHSKFVHKDIDKVSAKEIKQLFFGAKVKILMGCAPCQPFSTLNRKRRTGNIHDENWQPLERFAKLIAQVKPEIVSMENVKDLANTKKYPVFKRFLRTLYRNGYHVSYKVIDAAYYGIPQHRKRLVLLASRLGPIEMIAETHQQGNLVTVRDKIANLARIGEGQIFHKDPMHRSSKLSNLNKKRIEATPKNGGSATSWPEHLLPDCYKEASGDSYKVSVYGRMKWNSPSPTITTHCTTLGTGRFGHPTQNRAISLKEASLLQSFPKNYDFGIENNIPPTRIARHIGNAVPVKLGEVIALSIKGHLKKIKS
jgi:DNA (cytosine-5)-methyltransferase 1